MSDVITASEARAAIRVNPGALAENVEINIDDWCYHEPTPKIAIKIGTIAGRRNDGYQTVPVTELRIEELRGYTLDGSGEVRIRETIWECNGIANEILHYAQRQARRHGKRYKYAIGKCRMGAPVWHAMGFAIIGGRLWLLDGSRGSGACLWEPREIDGKLLSLWM